VAKVNEYYSGVRFKADDFQRQVIPTNNLQTDFFIQGDMVENYPTISGSRRYRGNSEPDLVGLDYMSLSSHVLLNSIISTEEVTWFLGCGSTNGCDCGGH